MSEIRDLIDQAGAELERQRYQDDLRRVKKDFPDFHLTKTLVNPPLSTPDPAPLLDDASQSAWDRWFTVRFDEHVEKLLMPAIGQALGMTERDLLTKINALRTDMQVAVSAQGHEIRENKKRLDADRRLAWLHGDIGKQRDDAS
jgi:hypothetical protein